MLTIYHNPSCSKSRQALEILRENGLDTRVTADDLPELDDDAALAAWIELHPRLLERSIVVDDARRRAVIGQPPENVLQLIETGNE